MRARVIVGLIVAVGTAAFVVWRLAFRDTTTPISASAVVEDAAADRSRGGDADAASVITAPGDTSAADGEMEPPSTTEGAGLQIGADFVVGDRPGDPGLYVYSTTGFEEIDALGGARHDYPAETFLTIQPGGCGTVQRWTALEERWDEVELCPGDGGFAVAARRAFHRWFGQSDLQASTCTPADAVAIPTVAAGRWAHGCSNETRSWTYTIEIVGTENIVVGGEPAAAVRVRETAGVLGETVGSSRTDTWYLEGTALVLRREVTRSNVSDSAIGPVTYHEEYAIELIGLAPSGG